MQQLKANRIITSQWEFDTYLSLFRDVAKSFENIEVFHNWGTERGIERLKRTGKNAFNTIQEFGIGGPVFGANAAIEDLKPVIDEFVYLIQATTDSGIERKEYLQYKMLRFYYTNFKGLLNGLIRITSVDPTQQQRQTIQALRELDDKITILEREVSSGIHTKKSLGLNLFCINQRIGNGKI